MAPRQLVNAPRHPGGVRHPPVDAWRPLSPEEAAAELRRRLDVPWWIGGGWALDLYIGSPTRRHVDLDVVVLRRDQLDVQAALGGTWHLYATQQPSPSRLAPWQEGRFLEPGVNSVWAAHGDGSAWAFEIAFMETRDDDWVFRRDPRIGGPVAGLGVVAATGIPVIRPEVQLLYKARHRRAKDDADLRATLPLLEAKALCWLKQSVRLHLGEAHPWYARILGSGESPRPLGTTTIMPIE
jgi:hypothetical protein